MSQHRATRRLVLSALTLAPFGLTRASPAAAQPGPTLPPIAQPAEPTRAAFFARARALRDQAVREGDQAYGAVVVRGGVIVGEGRNYVVLQLRPDRALRAPGGARRGAPARHPRSLGLRGLLDRHPVPDVPGRALLGARAPRIH